MPFQTTEAREQSAATLVCSDPGNSNSPFVPNIVLGRVTLNLLIVNAHYPDHDGVYTCIGSNDDSMININSATINVQVIGKGKSFKLQLLLICHSESIVTYYIKFMTYIHTVYNTLSVSPEVEVTASHLKVDLGASIPDTIMQCYKNKSRNC